MNQTTQARPARRFSLSLTAKICATATALVVLSLSVTSTFIGVKSSRNTEEEAFSHARTLAREATAMVHSRLVQNLTAVSTVATALEATAGSQQPLAREQINEAVRGMLLRTDDFVGTSATFEPAALDGKDLEYAGKKPHHDDAGRFLPYFSRGAGGQINVEPIVFGTAPGANDWYDVPKASGKVYFSDPYLYPVNGKDVLMASLAAPIMVSGKFHGVISGDLVLTGLSAMLAEMKVMEGAALALISNGGLYASHKDLARNGKKADDLPAAALEAVRQGKPYQYIDSQDIVHLLQPLRIHPDIAPWAITLSFPRSVATASARELAGYNVLVSIACALAAAGAMVVVLRRLTRPLRVLGRTMAGLTNGNADLSTRLDVRSNDELGLIATGFNGFVAKIESVLRRVNESSESVATAAGEILQGNSSLSSRTEQQASALEETAASMEELTSTVRQNADNAQQANQLAASASSVAVRGGEVVARVVETMASINDSSKKVVDIISVIDSIAFQTNILALNAAVEAARAGEQGRGFAVVASEVRNLAQRSASAAKEIKALIGDSVDKVGVGSALVADAGKTMEDVVASVRRVTDIVAEISAASAEQSAGIGQVNQAIGQMDGVTQQNAALVEEATAAAESLQRQSALLVSLVGEFRVKGEPDTRPRLEKGGATLALG